MASSTEEQIPWKNSNIIIKQLDMAEGLKDLPITLSSFIGINSQYILF